MTKFELINLEIKYLEYKSQYYIGGTSKISDAEFDYIEKVLKENNSTAVSQVGYKIKDFDWPHQSRMNSLSKIQTEENDNKENENKLENENEKGTSMRKKAPWERRKAS